MASLVSQGERVPKTLKLFIGGEFPRTESGRSFPVYDQDSKKVFAQLCQASRKDFRNAIAASLKACEQWQQRTAYNRAQILYRMAEMTEGHREDMVSVLKSTSGVNAQTAENSIDQVVDAFVYYAGFCDKYSQLSGCVNPVNGPHHAFTTPEPVGCVVCLFDDDMGAAAALPLVASTLASIITSGSVVTALLPTAAAAQIASLGEIFATSDLPKGVVNLLTGNRSELIDYMASHMEVQSVCYVGSDRAVKEKLKTLGAENMKRVVWRELHANAADTNENLRLENILSFVEYKTVWHPVGN